MTTNTAIGCNIVKSAFINKIILTKIGRINCLFNLGSLRLVLKEYAII